MSTWYLFLIYSVIFLFLFKVQHWCHKILLLEKLKVPIPHWPSWISTLYCTTISLINCIYLKIWYNYLPLNCFWICKFTNKLLIKSNNTFNSQKFSFIIASIGKITKLWNIWCVQKSFFIFSFTLFKSVSITLQEDLSKTYQENTNEKYKLFSSYFIIFSLI